MCARRRIGMSCETLWEDRREVASVSVVGRERPRLCENAPSRDLLRIFFLGRALTMMSEDFLAAVSPKSRPKFYFEKERIR